MNPYAPPQQAAPMAYGYGVVGGYAAWPDGANLAIQKDAPLPSVCVKCGQHGSERRNQQFVWTPPWVFIIFVISPVIAAIVALVVQKKGRLQLPLCPTCNARWKQGTLIIVGGVLFFLFAMIGGIIIAANELPEVGVPLVIASLVAPVVAIMIANKRSLRAAKIDERMILIPKIHPAAVQAILAGSAQSNG